MDTTDPNIQFNSEGVCNHCRHADEVLKMEPLCLAPEVREDRLNEIMEGVRRQGKGKKYDCIIGLSGGVDSSYVAYVVKKYGLKPLAVHLDNGWDSEIAVRNIENVCKRLSVDLYTYVIDWEEFRDLQLSFIKASTPDMEIPSDHAIYSIIFIMARKYGIKNVIMGYNMSSESILPRAWAQGHLDWEYIRDVQRKFGTKKLDTFPHISLFDSLWISYVLRITRIDILNYLEYDKEVTKEFLKKELGWIDYGRKHGESEFTRIFQEYILPTKFGYDKRKAHYSSMIAAGQMTRDEAKEMLSQPLYKDQADIEKDIIYLTKKFCISVEEFEKLMKSENKNYNDYSNYSNNPPLFYALLKRLNRIFDLKKIHEHIFGRG